MCREKHHFRRTSLLVLAMVAVASSSAAQTNVTGAGLLIAPTKLEFKVRERSASLYVHNSGNDAVTYRLTLIDLIATDTGIDGREYVRFRPRRVHLLPGQTQTVRVLVRPAPPGDYITRLSISALPPAPKPEAVVTEDGGIRIKLQMLWGVSIPIRFTR